MTRQAGPARAPAWDGADSPRLLGQINDRIVLDLLLDQGPMPRGQIGQVTGLSKPTVSTLLERLASRGLIEQAGVIASGPGPKARIYQVNAAACRVVGVHVEQRGSVAVLAAMTGERIASHEVPVPDRSRTDPRDEMREAVDGVLRAADLKRSDIDHLVIATPGVIDPETGTLRHARHFQGWEEPGLRDALEQDLGMPVSHGNDVNLAALAEGIHGGARGHDDYALVWLARGVGLGLVSDGTLRTGAHGGAGEIGYLPSPGLATPLVDRGETGAFQQLVGGKGIHALAEKHGIAGRTPEGIVAQAASEPPRGGPFLDDLAQRIALGVAAVATLLDPGIIVFGGPVALAGGRKLLRRVESAFARFSFIQPPLALSEVGSQGVLAGAIDMALRRARARLFPDAPARHSP